jgi:hypothetical protein
METTTHDSANQQSALNNQHSSNLESNTKFDQKSTNAALFYQKLALTVASHQTLLPHNMSANQVLHSNHKLALIIGYTERQQLLTYLSHTSQIDSQNSQYDAHDITVASVTLTTIDGTPAAIIRLHDVVQQDPVNNSTSFTTSTRVRGGNSYRTICTGTHHRQACAYVDHANDMYDVVCRLYDTCNDVSIYVTYVAFGAYRWDGVYVNKLVWRHNVCQNQSRSQSQSQTLNDSDTVANYSGWYRDTEHEPLRWLASNGQELPTDRQMQSCLEALPSPIELIGDSHLRYTYNEIISRTDTNARNLSLGKLKTTHTYKKYQFSYGGYAVEHATDIELMGDSHGILPRFKTFVNGSWIIDDDPQNVHEELTKWQKRERERLRVSMSSNPKSNCD